MLEDKYLETLGNAIASLFEAKNSDHLMLGKYIQNVYSRLLNEQERDLRDKFNGKNFK